MSWAPLQVHSYYSILRATPKPADIVKRCVKLGYKACALTDYDALSGCPSFAAEAQEAGIKPILGSRITTESGYVTVLAKNKDGWERLTHCSSKSYEPERGPKLPLKQIAKLAGGNFFVFSGGIATELFDSLFTNVMAAYRAGSYEDAKSLVRPDWKEVTNSLLGKYRAFFGDNFFVEIQAPVNPASQIVQKILRHVASEKGIHCVAVPAAHYLEKDDAADHRIIVTAGVDSNLSKVSKAILQQERHDLISFFSSNSFHLPVLQEVESFARPEEISNVARIVDACEDYNLFRRPLLPDFDVPAGHTQDTFLRERCKEGWAQKIVGKVPKSKWQEYGDRVKRELGIFQPAGLSSYFLIVDEICQYSRRELQCIQSKGRGSAAGCLISYLLDITDIDSVRYDLIVERFYNEGRNTEDRVALPDIDVDFPPDKREQVIQHIRDRYGDDRVSQMATYGSMHGRGAIKDVFRVLGRVSFDETNKITDNIPDPAAISDKLQQMEEETGESSTILFALEHYAKQLSPWCSLGKDGSLTGPLAKDFEQAIRLEGTKRSIGKHASGIVICSVPVAEVCPMIRDKNSGQMMTGVDHRDSELMGLVKYDILGSSILSKIGSAVQVIRTGQLC